MKASTFKSMILLCSICFLAFMDEPCRCETAGKKLNIVTTTTNLGAIAKAVGGEYVSISSLASGDEDPHFIEAKPSYMMKAKRANLWIRIGLELEIGYEGLILEGSRNQKIKVGMPGHLDASQGILRLEVPTERVTRSMGDVHPMGNPHYWLDPYNGRVIAKNIARRLKELDPSHSDGYDRNLAAFLLKLDNAMFGTKAVSAVGDERLWQMQLNGTLEKFIEDQNQKADPNAIGETLFLDVSLGFSKNVPLSPAATAFYEVVKRSFFEKSPMGGIGSVMAKILAEHRQNE